MDQTEQSPHWSSVEGKVSADGIGHRRECQAVRIESTSSVTSATG